MAEVTQLRAMAPGRQQELFREWNLTGSPRSREYVLFARVTGVAASRLTADGDPPAVNNLPIFEDDRAYRLDILCVVKGVGLNEMAIYKFDALGARRATGAASVVLTGTMAATVDHEDDANWELNVTADVVNGTFDLSGENPAGGKTLNYVAFVRQTEVGG